jgi:anti-sigma B factor antagonist
MPEASDRGAGGLEEQLRVEVLNGSGPVEVLLSGDIDLGTESRLTAALADLAGRDVIVDLSAVGFIDSTGLTSLLTGHRAITDAGGTLVLRKPSAMAARLLAVTAVDTVLKITD